MYPFHKITTFILAVLLFTGIYACIQNGNSQSSNDKSSAVSMEILERIPKLLDRNESLWYGKEWETVQNLYGKSRKELMQNPDAKEPWLALAEIFIQEARVTGEHPHYYTAALKSLNEVLSKEFDGKDIKDMDIKFRSLSNKASVELSLHEFAKALETGKQAIAINPYNAAIYGVMVDANVELGNYPEAVKMADKMVETRPDLRSYSRVSYLREIYGDIPGAIEAMQMATEAGYPGQEQTAWTRLNLGHLHEQYGKLKDAEMEYLVILQERPDYPFAIAALAGIELKRKNYSKAEDLLNKAVAIIPEVSYYESLADVYRQTGRQADFEKTVKEIITMMEDDAAHGHNMDLEFAKVWSSLANDQQKALQYALNEYKNRPENIQVNGLLAEIYNKTGDKEKAKMHLVKALKTGSKKPEWVAMF